MGNKVHTYIDGEPMVFEVATIGHHICCDCGLVHQVYVGKIKDKKCITYWYRDSYETRRLKKKKRKKK